LRKFNYPLDNIYISSLNIAECEKLSTSETDRTDRIILNPSMTPNLIDLDPKNFVQNLRFKTQNGYIYPIDDYNKILQNGGNTDYPIIQIVRSMPKGNANWESYG